MSRRSISIRARDLKGIKKILIGVRYDIAVEDPRYIKELATHHVGGYLKRLPGAYGRGTAVEDDEAGYGQLRPL
jgi:radical SAM superfamily enzyme YgiQ (UPF0313 family)